MQIHHLNCATFCPRGARMISGSGRILERASLVCHCLLIESAAGLILVDAGLGLEDIRNFKTRLGRVFRKIANPILREEETAIRRIEALGYRAGDVKHIVLTHLDPDHAGGISDFPKAKVHVFAAEQQAAESRRSLIEKERYRPAQWAHGPDWVLHPGNVGETWKGFQSIRVIDESVPEVLLIPLLGHTRGHCGVAVRGDDHWLLHAGDAYFHHGEMNLRRARCPKGLALFQKIVQHDGRARVENQARLRALAGDPAADVQIFCAHDPWELESFAKASALAQTPD